LPPLVTEAPKLLYNWQSDNCVFVAPPPATTVRGIEFSVVPNGPVIDMLPRKTALPDDIGDVTGDVDIDTTDCAATAPATKSVERTVAGIMYRNFIQFINARALLMRMRPHNT
jgi:hypothetical protein